MGFELESVAPGVQPSRWMTTSCSATRRPATAAAVRTACSEPPDSARVSAGPRPQGPNRDSSSDEEEPRRLFAAASAGDCRRLRAVTVIPTRHTAARRLGP